MEKTAMDRQDKRYNNDLVNGYRKVPLDADLQTDSDTRCGIGPCKPDCLQVFSNMLTFSLYYGVSSLVTSALSMYLTSQVTTLEKQFGLSSSETGMLLSMNDFGFLIFVLIISHFTRYAHKPRILGVCVFVFGCSAIVSAIPHFLTPEPELDDGNVTYTNKDMNQKFRVDTFSGESLCSQSSVMSNQTDQKCSQTEVNSKATAKFLALGIISAGMFFQGVAKSPRMAMSQTYIDDNVIKTKSGLHIGLIACLSVFGPATAFAIGAKISTIYVTLQETSLTTTDPRWIGAWWLGFLMFGFAAVLLSSPLFLFPRRMVIKSKNLQKQREARQLQLQQEDKLGLGAKIKDLPISLWRLATNFIYMSLIIASSVDFFALAGGLAFAPKFFEVYFGLSVFKANMAMGMTTIAAASTGMLAGGILTTKLKLGLVGCIKLMLLCRCLSGVIGTIPLFLDCPQPHIVGLEKYGQLDELSVNNSLRHGDCLDCSCQGTAFFPVCGSDGRNYFSPCVAGCSQKNGNQYTNCTCVSNETTTTPASGNYSEFTARPGLCPAECDLLTIFIVSQIIASFLGTTSALPQIIATMRSVSEKDKTLCVGLSSFVYSVLGWTLGPIVFGYIVDGTCSLWHTSCSKRGSCALYDGYDLRNKLQGVGVGSRVICVLIFSICLIRLVCLSKDKRTSKIDRNGTKTRTSEETAGMMDVTEVTRDRVRTSTI